MNNGWPLSHFRSILKCWPRNMDVEGDVQIELKSHCKLCPDRMQPGQRFAIYRKLKYDVFTNRFLTDLLDLQCVTWAKKYHQQSDTYDIHCMLTESF